MSTIGVTATYGGRSIDLAVQIDAQQRGLDLISALDDRFSIPTGSGMWCVERSGEPIAAASPLPAQDVLHGDVIVWTAKSAPGRVPQLRKVDGDGPELISLERATQEFGRASTLGAVRFSDLTVSGMQARIERRGTTVYIVDAGSTNGTFVNKVKLKSAEQILVDGDSIEFGERTLYRFVAATSIAPPGPHFQQVDGRLRLNRQPRAMQPQPSESFQVGLAPEEPRARRFPLPMMVLPLVLGVLVTVVMKNPVGMAFALMGPLMAGWNWFDDRQSGRREFRTAEATYLRGLVEIDHAASAARERLAQWRQWHTPSISVLAERIAQLSPELWSRQPAHPDFLDLRVGTAEIPSGVRISVADRGSQRLRDEAQRLAGRFTTEANAPVSVSLATDRFVGIAGGTSDARRNVASALMIQLAALNSPIEVTAMVLGTDDAAWQWARWLPHAQGVDGKRPLVATTAVDRDVTFAMLEDVLARRLEQQPGLGSTGAVRLPQVVLTFEAPTDVAPHRLNAVLASDQKSGLSVIALAPDRSTLPAACSFIIDLSSTPPAVIRTGGGAPVLLTTVDSLSQVDATALARRLAPVTDPSKLAAGAVPEAVTFADVFGAELADGASIAARWDRSRPNELRVPIGLGAAGPVYLDLGNDGDGPHGLVAGTSGAGKSEFLQALVVSLAATYSPKDLNFLFVDFKGGLTFRDLVNLPHSVGMIRNLDGKLALRAKRSLLAELRRRQHILHQHGAVNLAELRKRAPEAALPALALITDEFAELAEKLPEFLEGIVEIAQTGRALGIHLLLATQSPGQSVSEAVKNCSKYRISFRLLNPNESQNVLGRGRDASQLPNKPGRGLLKDGGGDIVEFQAAFAGARTDATNPRGMVAETLYRPKPKSRGDSDGATDLEQAIEAIRDAAALSKAHPPRLPWHAPLPLTIALSQVPQPIVLPTPGSHRVALGLADLPDEQAQPPYVWDLGRTANLMVLGDGATGKTTVLRSAAAAFARNYDQSQVRLVGVDGSGGSLASIESLPNTIAVIDANIPSSLRRTMAFLQTTVKERRKVIGKAGSLRTWRLTNDEALPDIVVLVDVVENVLTGLEMLDGAAHQAPFVQLFADGPAMGVHFLVTTAQPQRVPMTLNNAVPEKLFLRMASNDASYLTGSRVDLEGLPNGRGLRVPNPADVQIAIVGETDRTDALAQQDALSHLGDELRRGGRLDAPRLPEPPEVLGYGDLRPTNGAAAQGVVIGIDDIVLQPLVLDFSSTTTLAIIGPDGSGRTNLIEVVRAGLVDAHPELTTVLISGRSAPLHFDRWTRVIPNFAAELDFVEEMVPDPSTVRSEVTTLIAIDDGDDLLEIPIGGKPDETQALKRLAAALDAMIRAGRNGGVIVILAGRLFALNRVQGWPLRIRQNQQAVLLMPASLGTTVTDPIFNVTLPRRSDFTSEPGRGVLVRRGSTAVVQAIYADKKPD